MLKLFGKKKEKQKTSHIQTNMIGKIVNNDRVPLFPIKERIHKAKFIHYNSITYSAPDKPDGGMLDYVDEHGDVVTAFLERDTERVEVFGFGIEEELNAHQMGVHQAYKTKHGLLVLQTGAMWKITKEDGTVVVPEAHTISWIGDKIYTTTGASYRIFDAYMVGGTVVETEDGLMVVAEQGTEKCHMCRKNNVSGEGYERSVCGHCQRKKDDLDWQRMKSN